MVKEVEGFGAELEMQGFGEREDLLERRVDFISTGTPADITSEVAVGAGSGNSKGSRIEPVIDCLIDGVN